MSLISGSYSLFEGTGGAALLSEDIVEKDDATAVRAVIGVEGIDRRAIGLTALQVMAERWRRDREAALHRLRLKADILELAFVVPGRPQFNFEERKKVSYVCI